MMTNAEIEEMGFDDADYLAYRWGGSAVFLYRWNGDIGVGVVPGATDCVFEEDGELYVRIWLPDTGVAEWYDKEWLVENVCAVALGVLEVDGDLDESVAHSVGYRVQVATDAFDQRGFLATVYARLGGGWTYSGGGLSVRQALLEYGIVDKDFIPRARRRGRGLKRQQERERAEFEEAQEQQYWEQQERERGDDACGAVPGYGGDVPGYGGDVPGYGGDVPDYGGDVPDYGGSDGGTDSDTSGTDSDTSGSGTGSNAESSSVGGTDVGGGSDAGYGSAGDDAGDTRLEYERGWAAGYAAGCGAE